MDTYAPLGAALTVMFVSLSGILFSATMLRDWMTRNLTYLTTFAGGVFLLVVYHLLEETLHESSSLSLAAGSVLFGAAIMIALHHLMPSTHHHHHVQHDHSHTRIDGRRVLVSDAFHNIGDGVLLVAAFAVSWPIGVSATIGIVVHEFVQEISEYFILREAGYTTWKALSRNVLSASTILVGVGFAAFLASAEQIAILFAGIAAGGFLTVLTQDLLPHALLSVQHSGGAWKHAVAAALGVMLMLGIQSVFSHEEPDGLAFATVTTNVGAD
jgi:zinc and cadmium transporter